MKPIREGPPNSRVDPSLPARSNWSSHLAVYLGTIGAAVGLGSLWRFPYLAGTGGGSAFILVFVLACAVIATPLLAAEFALGRRSRSSPPQAAGVLAASLPSLGASPTSLAANPTGDVPRNTSRAAAEASRWNAIGILGTLAAYLIFSYYTVIAGWVLAYTWKCAAGTLSAAGPQHVGALWAAFRSHPLEIGAWHTLFVLLALTISSRGLHKGIEPADRIRAPALLVLLLILAIYSLTTGDARRAFAFAFAPRFSELTPQIALAAVGQAFYATGVGQAMMMAYGAYMDRGTSLVRVSVSISASILLVSLLATIMIFPLVFEYGMNPAQGPALVFEVLPRVFTEMPGGRVIGTLFFALLVLAALMPSIASLEPSVAWLIHRRGLSRAKATWLAGALAWILGIGTVLSFNTWSAWHPLALLRPFADKTFFDLLDYGSSNILMPGGAFLTSLFMGWRATRIFNDELCGSPAWVRAGCIGLLRYVCPVVIAVLCIAAMA